MTNIKKGDRVVLKSGGPIMTVQQIGDFPNVGIAEGAMCIWFDDKRPIEKIFDVATLEVYTEDY